MERQKGRQRLDRFAHKRDNGDVTGLNPEFVMVARQLQNNDACPWKANIAMYAHARVSALTLTYQKLVV